MMMSAVFGCQILLNRLRWFFHCHRFFLRNLRKVLLDRLVLGRILMILQTSSLKVTLKFKLLFWDFSIGFEIVLLLRSSHSKVHIFRDIFSSNNPIFSIIWWFLQSFDVFNLLTTQLTLHDQVHFYPDAVLISFQAFISFLIVIAAYLMKSHTLEESSKLPHFQITLVLRFFT